MTWATATIDADEKTYNMKPLCFNLDTVQYVFPLDPDADGRQRSRIWFVNGKSFDVYLDSYAFAALREAESY